MVKITQMKKTTLRQAALRLALVALAVLAPLGLRAQDLADYTFSTGTDANQWITLSNPTQIVATAQDDAASSMTDIGFSFPFGDNNYTQFWANSNGIFSFSSSPATSYSTQFTSYNLSANQPKICGITRDMCVPSSGGYVKYELFGTAPNRPVLLLPQSTFRYSSMKPTPKSFWFTVLPRPRLVSKLVSASRPLTFGLSIPIHMKPPMLRKPCQPLTVFGLAKTATTLLSVLLSLAPSPQA